MTSALIDDATRAIAANAWSRALPPLLAVWRATPSPRLAALIEAVSDRAEQGMAKLEGTTVKARLATATALIKKRDPIDLPRIMRLLPDVQIAHATVLAGALDKYLPDPRYLANIVALLRASPWGASTSRTLWRVLLGHLEQAGDPRAVAQLSAIDFTPIVDSAWGARTMTETVAKACAKLAAKPETRSPTEPPGLAAAEALVAQRGSNGVDLLAAIRADPSDLGARAIYADWLTEQGDPRGEFITLQLATQPTDDQRRRARALVADHGGAWLGPIARQNFADEFWRFTNGFVAAARVDPARAVTVADDPDWATLEEIWLACNEDLALPSALIDAPHLRALRFVGGLYPRHCAELATIARPLTGLGFELPSIRDAVRPDERAAVAAIARPDVREVAFDRGHPAQLAWFWDTALGSQVTRLRSSSGLASLPAWLAKDAVPARVATMQISFNDGWHGWTFELARGANGTFSRVDAVLRRSLRDYASSKVGELLDLFDELPANALEHFSLRLDGTSATKADLAAVAARARAAPAQPRKEVRATAAAAAASDARAAFVRVLDALPPKHPATHMDLRDLDYGNSSATTAAQKLLARAKPPFADGWADVCFALLALPVGRGEADRGQAIHAEAVRILGAIAPAGALARVIPILEAGTCPALNYDLSCVPTAELPALFDWFETRRGDKAPPRADVIYQAVTQVAVLRGTAKTRAELSRRAAKKQLRFVKWAYDRAIDELAGRK